MRRIADTVRDLLKELVRSRIGYGRRIEIHDHVSAVAMHNTINNTAIANQNAAMASITNIEARLRNSMAAEMEDVITVIRINAGNAPPGYPGTLRAFFNLTNPETAALLNFYRLPVPYPKP